MKMNDIAYAFKLAGEVFTILISLLSVTIMYAGSSSKAAQINPTLLRQLIVFFLLAALSSAVYLVIA